VTREVRARSGLVALAGLAALLIVLAPCPAAGHHVGVYVARDNEVSANFKQLKFAIQAARFDAASRLFEEGAVRAEMRAQAGRLPPGLEQSTRAALKAGDARGAERCLMILFAGLARDLAVEADRRLADSHEPAGARAAAGRKFLEAIWRYYNLVDFAVTQYDSTAGVAIRLAFDEAEGYARDPAAGPSAPAASSRPLAARPTAPPDPAKMREPLRRIAQTLSQLIDTSSTTIRRGS
jgi:hypothetical protein